MTSSLALAHAGCCESRITIQSIKWCVVSACLVMAREVNTHHNFLLEVNGKQSK